MLAAFCPEAGRFDLRNVPQPAAAPADVVIKVRNCGICGSDLHYYHGGFVIPPVCPGHEISGEVVEVGSAVRGRAAGDRVAVEPLLRCGECPACRVGDYQLCRHLRILGTHADGGFAQLLAVPAYATFTLPPALDWAVAALAEPTAVCVHAVRLANVRLGDRVAVIGAGTIGLLAALAAKDAGASEVLITARHPHQRAAAERLGARPFGEQQDDELIAYAYDHPVDAVIETVGGSADTIKQAMMYVRPGGIISVLGVFTGPVSINPIFLILKEVRIVGSLTYGRVGPRADFDIALDLLARHREQVASLVTHQFPLAEIATAFGVASDKHQGSIKVSIQP